jgi:hypothetical protein
VIDVAFLVRLQSKDHLTWHRREILPAEVAESDTGHLRLAAGSGGRTCDVWLFDPKSRAKGVGVNPLRTQTITVALLFHHPNSIHDTHMFQLVLTGCTNSHISTGERRHAVVGRCFDNECSGSGRARYTTSVSIRRGRLHSLRHQLERKSHETMPRETEVIDFA